MSADEEIRAREERMERVSLEFLDAAWLREIANELTRLRHTLAAQAPAAPTQPAAGPQKE